MLPFFRVFMAHSPGQWTICLHLLKAALPSEQHLCCSIFTTISIALERFFPLYLPISLPFRYYAVCQPFKYRLQSRPENINIRVIKYLLVVIIASLFINWPRFFETKIVIKATNETVDGLEGDRQATYELTSLRRNPDYIRWNVFFRFWFFIVMSLFQILQQLV